MPLFCLFTCIEFKNQLQRSINCATDNALWWPKRMWSSPGHVYLNLVDISSATLTTAGGSLHQSANMFIQCVSEMLFIASYLYSMKDFLILNLQPIQRWSLTSQGQLFFSVLTAKHLSVHSFIMTLFPKLH